MNIMVFDVPADSGGALSILNEFYDEAKLCKDINWIFVLSKPKLQETNNIKVLRYPWIKKSWMHRLYFDKIISHRLVRKYKINKIMSFQNVVIPNTKINQVLYVHQALPFINYKFTFKENKLFWIYQNLIGKIIIKSIKKANNVIVQTEWMKRACIEKASVMNEKICIVPPKIKINVNKFFEGTDKSFSTFFYPASALTYKNHKVIIKACRILKENNVNNFKVVFTLKGNENGHICKLYKEVEELKLNIEFIGNITREKVFDMYSKSVLIFPSYIESYGLPLVEAKLHKDMILASDCNFSHEILNGYENAYFFDPQDSQNLANLMSRIIKHEINYKESQKYNNSTLKEANLINTLLNISN